jgi:shikimate kinase
MGAGKSTVGPLVALGRGVPFVDLDDLISERSGQPTGETLSHWGEPRFRAVEADLLDTIGQGEACVVATGGGTPTTPAGRTALRHFDTIWLDVSFERVSERVEGSARPLWSGDIHGLFEARRATYSAVSSRRVDANLAVEEVVAECLRGSTHG